MQTLKIGRDAANDIVIADSKVSRKHIQITSDNGHFMITDLGSTNGTFVNGQKIDGEAEIFAEDIVKIGNTILDWEKLFRPEKRKKEKKWLVWLITGIIAALIIFAVTAILLSQDKTHEKTEKIIVKMHEKNGVRYIPMKINGQELDFVFDTGASSICISTLEAMILYKNGMLKEEDFIGTKQFLDASGNISVGATIKLKTVQIGEKTLENVEATIIKNPKAECLFGQTVLSKFGKYTIDNQNNVIIFE